ncbi:MAG: alkaline phosphatase family protein [Caldilineaceae bacterium]|nr:alkaline phosphatase family protein [Caldilineaceae bacterium]
MVNENLTLFIMLDGLRPDALGQCDCLTLQGLIRRGASTLHASSVMPSVTLPCHMSIFHSVPPTRHGVTTNDWQPMARPLPGLLDVVKASGKRAAAIYNWEPLRNLGQPNALHAVTFRDCSYDVDGDDWVTEKAIETLTRYPTDFAFVYYGTIDVAGHDHQWMSAPYLRQIERVDRNLGQLLTALPTSIHLVAQADHGGHERSHGTEMAEDMTIPWIAAGPQIRRGYTISHPVSLLDTAPTLARIIGLQAPRDWEGRCVDEIFVETGQ